MSDQLLTTIGLALRDDFQQWHQQMLEGFLGEALSSETWQQDGQTLVDLEQEIAELSAPEQAWLTLQASLTADFLPTPEGQSSTALAAGNTQPVSAHPISTEENWLGERHRQGKSMDPGTASINRPAIPLEQSQLPLKSVNSPSMETVARSPAPFIDLQDTSSSPPALGGNSKQPTSELEGIGEQRQGQRRLIIPLSSQQDSGGARSPAPFIDLQDTSSSPPALGGNSKQPTSELEGIGEQRQGQRRLIIPLSSQQDSGGVRLPVQPMASQLKETGALIESILIEPAQSGEAPAPLPRRSTPLVTYLPLSSPASSSTAAPIPPGSTSKSLRDLANLLELTLDQDLSWDLAKNAPEHSLPNLQLNPLLDRTIAVENDHPHSSTQLTADFFSESLSSSDQEQPLPTLPKNHDSVEEWRSDQTDEFVPVSAPPPIPPTINDSVKLPAPSYSTDHAKSSIAALPDGVPLEQQDSEMELPKITIERLTPETASAAEVDLEAIVSALRQEIVREYHRFYGG
jgi:hypothetical protein